MDQLGKVANPARDQLNREKFYFPFPVEYGPARRRVRPSRSASARSFSTLMLNLVLIHAVPPDFRSNGVHLIYHQPPPDQSLVNRVTQFRNYGVPCQESAGTGPGVFKLARVTGAGFS